MANAGWSDGRRLVVGYVNGKVTSLQRRFLSSQGKSSAAADLARLRRSASKEPGVSPEVWGVEFDGMPESLIGSSPEPSAGEWAVHIALTLYAIHQQSQTQEMHRQHSAEHPSDIGNAVKILSLRGAADTEEIEPGEMPRRFSAMVTGETIQEVAHYARQLVQQLRAEQIPMDYARLAGQLFDYQNPYRRDATRLEWGREFARPIRQQSNGENQE